MTAPSRFVSSPVLPMLLVGAAFLAGCHPTGANQAFSGHELYDSCKSCHKEGGQGDVTLAAPAIAGLPSWYVNSQLNSFRTGMRGAHPDDYEGLRMRPMSRQMANDQEIGIVTTYVAGLKPVKVAATLGGDAEAGKTTYAVCGACHGLAGQGNVQLKAPPLAGQADWYVVSQLKKFKSGIRGAMPGDTMGAQMRPMAMTLTDEQSMKNVAAYIATFPR